MQWPLLAISLLFLVAFSIQVIAQPSGRLSRVLNAITWIVWAAFAVDYLGSLALARQRGRWFVMHPLNLALVIFPGLAPLRLARFIYVVALLQRRAGAIVRGRIVTYVCGAAALLTWVAAVSVLSVERTAPDASIRTIGDALWWAVETITTVGYGDYTPVTLVGRLLAVGLMICGIALVSVITATFASWLLDQVRAEGVSMESAPLADPGAPAPVGSSCSPDTDGESSPAC